MSLSNKYLQKFQKNFELTVVQKTYNQVEVKNVVNLQKGYLNFYEHSTISPFVPKGSFGPWIITTDDKVIYDVGGYGMVGLGHNNTKILRELGKPQTMANIMTPSISQKKFFEIFQIKTNNKYYKIACLNSGSEANTFACRLANTHNEQKPVLVHLEGSFHGRTETPSYLSDSCRNIYQSHLYDYKNEVKKLYKLKVNCIDTLEKTFACIEKNGEYPELTIFEPVMGEGNPGLAITPEFYKKLRELTKKHNGLLLADSIQAGLRCCGELSVANYPGFENLDPPDIETFSKALNGGQFPFSVIAMNKKVVDRYKDGLYGNTMSSNPRALDVAIATLQQITPRIKQNIVDQGKYFLQCFEKLKQKHESIDDINGTGLLVSIFLKKNVNNIDIERKLRLKGLNIIHGGNNSLRLTPWFLITKEEIDMICDIIDEVLIKI